MTEGSCLFLTLWSYLKRWKGPYKIRHWFPRKLPLVCRYPVLECLSSTLLRPVIWTKDVNMHNILLCLVLWRRVRCCMDPFSISIHPSTGFWNIKKYCWHILCSCKRTEVLGMLNPVLTGAWLYAFLFLHLWILVNSLSIGWTPSPEFWGLCVNHNASVIPCNRVEIY